MQYEILGEIRNAENILKMKIVIKGIYEDVTNEVKRIGLVHDLDNCLELR